MTKTSAARDYAAEYAAARRRANRTDLTVDQVCRAINRAMRIDDQAREAGIELLSTYREAGNAAALAVVDAALIARAYA